MCYTAHIVGNPYVCTVPVLGGWLKLMALDNSVLRLSVTTCLCLRRNVCNHITKGSIINGIWSLMASSRSLLSINVWMKCILLLCASVTCCKDDWILIGQSYLSVAVVTIDYWIAISFHIASNAFLLAKLKSLTPKMWKMIYYMPLLDMLLMWYSRLIPMAAILDFWAHKCWLWQIIGQLMIKHISFFILLCE